MSGEVSDARLKIYHFMTGLTDPTLAPRYWGWQVPAVSSNRPRLPGEMRGRGLPWRLQVPCRSLPPEADRF